MQICFTDILKPHISQTTDATDSHQYKHTKQAKTRAGGQVVEEDDKVEAEETEGEKHYVPYYL